ncbi:MAG: DUF3857 domain-containing protein [Acidobacteria bacterium]|nr:DUF3857 domain-containing protein [Acidobacteriota bacterium]MCB9398774.1 DUF3857 domain-containing protein [Acidobacteriota bacterium]
MITLFLMTLSLQSEFSIPKGLPDWALRAFAGVDLNETPDADIWRLLDETVITCQRKGQWETRRRTVQIVLKQKGAEDAATYTISGDEKASKIKKLKGWHAHPQKGLDKLDKDNVITIGKSTNRTISFDNETLVYFEHVSKGSVIAFESIERITPFFNLSMVSLLDESPIRHLKIQMELGTNPGQITLAPMGLDTWAIKHELSDKQFDAWDLPGLEFERLTPDAYDFYPYLVLGFLDSEEKGDPLQSWDSLAKWYASVFQNKAFEQPYAGTPAADLKSLFQDFRQRIRYKQVYLDNERGWVPLSGAQIEQQAYGDCKDMVSCFAFRAKPLGLTVWPALANVGDESPHTHAEQRASPAFNHLIAAVEVADDQLPATLQIQGKNFLLVDATSAYTPFGYLPVYFRGREVMICLPEGAAWVSIPEKALEPNSVHWQLNGSLNADRTFEGTLEAECIGTVHQFRYAFHQGGQQALLETIRAVLDTPGYCDIAMQEAKVDGDGKLHFRLTVRWPVFLRRDAEGFRLPSCVVSPGIVTMNQDRVAPIAVPRQEKEIWDLQLKSAVALRFGADEAQYSDGICSYHWKAQSGTDLQIHFESQREGKIFEKQEIPDGLAYWQKYRSNFNAFSVDATFAMLQ